MQKSGTYSQSATRPERYAMRLAIIAAAMFVKVEGPTNDFDVYIPNPHGTPVYLGRVGESAYGDIGRHEPIEMGWSYKYADDVIGRQPWQSGYGIKTREAAAYRLLPDTI